MGFSGLRPSDCSPQLARLGALGALGYPPPAVPSPARGTNLRRFPGHAVTTSASRLGEPYSCSCSTLYPFRSSPDDSRLTTPSRPSTPLRNPRGHIKDSSDLPKAHGTLIPPIILFHRPFFSPPPTSRNSTAQFAWSRALPASRTPCASPDENTMCRFLVSTSRLACRAAQPP